MRFRETPIAGAWLIELEPAEDERGLFARTFDAGVFAERGLPDRFAQCSMSHNRRAGTLRGMHWQAAPHEERKVVRCTAGAAFDVLLDLRPGSPSNGSWHGVELTAENRRSVYVPAGVAHGFQTLADATELLYMIDVPYAPGSVGGVRWDDPAFAIEWPEPPGGEWTMSERDRTFPDYVRDPPTGSTS